MSELSPTEQKVFDSVARHGGSTGVNPDTIAAALPTLDIYDIVERLIDRGVLQRFGGAVRISDAVPPANAEANARRNAPVAMAPPVEEKKRNARPYFAHLDPQKDLTKQVASRIAQYLAAEGDEITAWFT